MEAELLGLLISAPKRGEWSVRALSASSSVDKTLHGSIVSLDFVLDRNNVIKMQRCNGMNIIEYLSALSPVDKTLHGSLVSVDFVLDRNNIIKMQRYKGMNISGYGKKSAAHAGIPVLRINVVFS